jgi:hypothetical protein
MSETHFRRQALIAARTLGHMRHHHEGGDLAIIATVAACMGIEDYLVQFAQCSRVEAQNRTSEILGRVRVEKIFFAIENILAQKVDTPVAGFHQQNIKSESCIGFNGTCAEDLLGKTTLLQDEDC